MSRISSSRAAWLVLAGTCALPMTSAAQDAPTPKRWVSNPAPEDADPRAEARRAEAIEALKGLPAKATGSRRAELLFRLAELYRAEAASRRRAEMLVHDQAYVQWVEAGQIGEPPELERFLRGTRAAQRTVQTLYARALEADPGYLRSDEVLLAWAQLHLRRGDADGAQARLRQLVARYPASSLVPQAHLQLGEIHFAADRLPAARRHYQAAAREGGPSSVVRFATYKLAWCDLNAQVPEAGVQKLLRVVRASRAAGPQPGEVDLATEALSDLVLFFTRANAPEQGRRAFERWAPPERARRLVRRLAASFDATGDWATGVTLRRALLEDPSPDAHEVQLGLLSGLERLGRLDEALACAEGLAAPRRTWDEDSATALLDVAAKSAQPSAKPAHLRLARATYAAYLEHAEAGPRATEARYFLATVEDRLGHRRAAAEAFDAVTASAHAGRLFPLAAFESVLAWERAFESSPERTTARAEAEVGLVAAARRFVEQLSTHPQRPAVQLELAARLAARGAHADADRHFMSVIADAEDTDLVVSAARAVLAPLEAEARWSTVDRRATEIADLVAPRGLTALSSELRTTALAAAYRGLQRDEREARTTDELARIAEGFARIADRAPHAALADDALVSARRLFERGHRLDRALETAARLAEAYPGSDHAVDNQLAYARLHERIGDHPRAARLLAQFEREHPDHAESKDAVFDAGLYFFGLREFSAARGSFTRFLSRHAGDPDAPKVDLLRCKTFDAPDRRASCLRRLFARYPRAPEGYLAQVRLLQIQSLQAADRHREARRWMRALTRRWSKLPAEARADDAVRTAAAYAAFHLVEPEFAAYLKREVTLRSRDLVRKLNMAKALGCAPEMPGCAAAGAYYSVLEYGDAEVGVAALTRIGQVFANVAQSLRAAPVPRHLTAEQAELYRAQVERLVLPLEERATEALQAAVQEARRLGVYDEWALTAETALRDMQGDLPDLQPRLTAPVERMVTAPAVGTEPGPASRPAEAP